MARTSKRSAPKPPPELGPEAGPTFGEVVTGQGLVAKLSKATRDIIGFVNDAATEHARVHLQVVSCFTCTVPSCCSLMVDIYLYEAVPMVARLLAEGRDTPELRARLAAAAHAMETTRKEAYKRPCVFLGDDGRCTVYADRPSMCGNHLVSSPAEACADPTVTEVVALTGPLAQAAQPEIEDQFVLSLGLRQIPVRYRGALPRMVLLCLEAWPRRDYISFLAARALPAFHRFEWATR